MSTDAPTQPPRKDRRKHAPLPTFNLTVEEVSPMQIVRDRTEVYRTVNLKFTDREKAEQLVTELNRQLAISKTSIPSVTVDGRVTQ